LQSEINPKTESELIRVEYHTVQIQTEQNRIQLSEILRRKKEKLARDLYKFKDEMK
jgi:hypothetical protein